MRNNSTLRSRSSDLPHARMSTCPHAYIVYYALINTTYYCVSCVFSPIILHTHTRISSIASTVGMNNVYKRVRLGAEAQSARSRRLACSGGFPPKNSDCLADPQTVSTRRTRHPKNVCKTRRPKRIISITRAVATAR